jgi:signal transduction histidine kinase
MNGPLRVLQIEDSESDAALIVRALEKARYQVEWVRVEDAAGMRAALAERAWDVIIADYHLPQFDAPAALRILRDSGLDIPFIVVSAIMGEDTAVEMMKSGAHDYLLKDRLARLGPAVERELRDAETRRERRRAEETVERMNRMKAEFLARCSHELRTPLNAIVGYAELLGEQAAGPLPPPYPRFVANIQEGARHLLAMVNDLLDISKIEAGRVDLNLETFRLADALGEVLAVVTPLARIKHIAVDNQVPAGMVIRADRIRLKQVLYNLLSNAVKFTPENGRVWIADASQECAAGFCVGDTGIGIAESERAAIFDEFHRVGGSAGSATEGTGLGLAITRRWVELHGGTIRVESTLGQGSRFIVSLGPHSAVHDGAVEV